MDKILLTPAVTTPVRDGKLSDQVYEQLLALIIGGEFAEHSRLPAENDLAERFGVSRPVLREALARLRDDGIVQSRRGSGSFVCHRPDRAVLKFAPIGSIADIQRCLEFRIEIESAAARFAALRRDEGDLKRIKAALTALDDCVATGRLGVEADLQFHREICRATKNGFFISAFESLYEQITFGMNLGRNMSQIKPAARLQPVQQEHNEVFEAIRAGDGAGAEAAMSRHLANSRQRMFQGSDSV